MIKTDVVVTARELRRILGVGRRDPLPDDGVIGTCAGEWIREEGGLWRAWEYPDWAGED